MPKKSRSQLYFSDSTPEEQEQEIKRVVDQIEYFLLGDENEQVLQMLANSEGYVPLCGTYWHYGLGVVYVLAGRGIGKVAGIIFGGPVRTYIPVHRIQWATLPSSCFYLASVEEVVRNFVEFEAQQSLYRPNPSELMERIRRGTEKLMTSDCVS